MDVETQERPATPANTAVYGLPTGPKQEERKEERGKPVEQRTTERDTESQEGRRNDAPAASDDETKARSAGWLPLEEFVNAGKGSKDDWRSAKEFNERTELYQSMRNLRKSEKESAKTIAALSGQLKKAMELIRDGQLSGKLKEREEAIELADKEKVRKLDSDIEKIKTDFEPPKVEAKTQPEIDDRVVAWGNANPWFKSDPLARQAAMEFFQQENLQNPDDLDKNLSKTTAYIKKRFPDLFLDIASQETPRRSAVEQPGRAQAPRRAGKTFADLPEEAKTICRSFEKRGVMSRDQYVKDYFEQFGERA